jgi:hypothetical protein
MQSTLIIVGVVFVEAASLTQHGPHMTLFQQLASK